MRNWRSLKEYFYCCCCACIRTLQGKATAGAKLKPSKRLSTWSWTFTGWYLGSLLMWSYRFQSSIWLHRQLNSLCIVLRFSSYDASFAMIILSPLKEACCFQWHLLYNDLLFKSVCTHVVLWQRQHINARITLACITNVSWTCFAFYIHCFPIFSHYHSFG